MMRRRMVGRSVARVAVGTAVVAGTAGAVQPPPTTEICRTRCSYDNNSMIRLINKAQSMHRHSSRLCTPAAQQPAPAAPAVQI